MANSSSIPAQLPTQKLELGLLIPDLAPSDSVYDDVEVQRSESSIILLHRENDLPSKDPLKVIEETDYDDAVLCDVLEKQFRQLIIGLAEVEAGSDEILLGGRGEEKDTEVIRGEDVDEEKDGESLVEENEDEESVEGNPDGHELEVASAKGGRYNIENGNRRKLVYPIRADAEDCSFYVKFATCKFGSNCKFNHPPRKRNQGVKEKVKKWEQNPERVQIECKYYFTSGGCKYGKECKYFHGSDKTSTPHVPEFNFLGLPIRPGEKECPYYLRTGSCKYGSNCRFHHPEPTTVTASEPPSGFGNGGSLSSQLISSSSVSSRSSPRNYNVISPFLPVIYPPTQGPPALNSEWNGYQASAYSTSEWSLPTPPAFVMDNRPTEINFNLRPPHELVEEYPERPGEQECSFFLKTGECKYKSNCKFHHPKNRSSKAKISSYVLNDKGLPLRPDQPICTHYHRFGICKYGPACKYDHPLNYGTLPPPFEQKPFGDIRNFEGAGKFRK